jgi:ribosomal-protein-alanine acetyltransferase
MLKSFKNLTYKQFDELKAAFYECFPEKPENELKSYFKNPLYHIDFIEIDDELASFVICHILAPEAEIMQIGTIKKFQGSGFASKILKQTIDNLKELKIEKIFLEVSENNIAAISIYSKLGFVEYARRKGYYKPKNSKPEDAISMHYTM